jgi:periplasmic divalent cation tolerance protein
MPDVVILYTTWPDAEKARAAGEAAVAAQLAACVNIFAPIASIYHWQGQIERAEETPMTLKTTSDAAPELKRLLVDRHPCETPCILALPVSAELSHAGFLAWVEAETRATASSEGGSR